METTENLTGIDRFAATIAGMGVDEASVAGSVARIAGGVAARRDDWPASVGVLFADLAAACDDRFRDAVYDAKEQAKAEGAYLRAVEESVVAGAGGTGGETEGAYAHEGNVVDLERWRADGLDG